MSEPLVKPTATASAEQPVAKPVEAQSAAPNTPAAPVSPAPTDAKVSSKFAALSRKERSVVQKQQEVNARLQELAAKEKAIAEREAAFEKAWKEDPLKAMEARGITYAEMTNRILNDGKPSAESEVASVRAEVERLRKEKDDEREAAHQAAIKAEKDAHEAAIAQFKEGVKSFVKEKADTYELINVNEASNLVISTIEEYFQQTGKILSTDAACDEVEKFLEEQVRKSTETKKFKAKASPQPGDPKAEPKQTSTSAGSQSKTLTNNMTASTPGFLPAKNERERIARAMAALERAKA